MNQRTTFIVIAALTGLLSLAAWMAWSPVVSTASAESPSTQPANSPAEVVMVDVKVFKSDGQLVGPIRMPKVVKTDEEWRKELTPEQYKIARGKGTEAAFCGRLLDNHLDGVYTCISCGLPLFSSDNKFDSGTGWPSFFQPVAKENVVEHPDNSYGMKRTEILCARCDCHLGHVFDDGPRPTGLRFCVNSESLKFVESDQLATLADPAITQSQSASPATQPSASEG
jgi:methionine-R-sulfoxide reductase